jgi:hypothetical protein
MLVALNALSTVSLGDLPSDVIGLVLIIVTTVNRTKLGFMANIHGA